MKWLFAYGIFMFASLANAQTSTAWDVAICGGCSTTAQYEAAARQAAGTSFNGERQFLVINPETNGSVNVLVMNVPTGEVPYSVTPGVPVAAGFMTALEYDPDRNIVFVDDSRNLNATAAGSTTTSWATTSQEKAEIGALIEFGRNDFVIVLPDNDLFSSFNSRNEPAVANQIFSSMTQKNPGWFIQQLGTRIRELVKNRLKVAFGKSFQVCAVFNNGDSACFEPDVATPSLEHLIEGSAKTRSGTPITSSGGGGGMATNTTGGTTGYGPTGSVGGSGSLWLFCSFTGGKLTHCWTQIF